jgi:hypothetical protein
VGRRVDRAAKRENRDPHDLVTAALEWYFLTRHVPEETPAPAELRAIRRARTAFASGDYVFFDEPRKAEAPRRARRKAS